MVRWYLYGLYGCKRFRLQQDFMVLLWFDASQHVFLLSDAAFAHPRPPTSRRGRWVCWTSTIPGWNWLSQHHLANLRTRPSGVVKSCQLLSQRFATPVQSVGMMTHILLSQNWLFPLKLRITWGRWSVFLHSNNLFCWQPCKPAIFTRQSIYKKVLCTVRHKRLTATTVYIRRPIHQNKTFTPKGFDRPSLKQSYGDESNTVEEREGKKTMFPGGFPDLPPQKG